MYKKEYAEVMAEKKAEPAGKKTGAVYSPNDKRRYTMTLYQTLISLIASLKPASRGTRGNGSVPEEPNYVKGKN